MDFPVRNGRITYQRKFGKGEATITAAVIKDVHGGSRIRLTWLDGARPTNAVVAFAHKLVAALFENTHDESDMRWSVGDHGNPAVLGSGVLSLVISEVETSFSGAAALTANTVLTSVLKTFQP